MKKILLLDCTLRDGGYVNSWHFGRNNIDKIVRKTIQSGTEIIECGYLSKDNESNPDYALFDSIEAVKKVYVQQKNPAQRYAVMINYGEYPIENFSPAEPDSPIIRLAFHKKDITGAFEYMKKLEQLKYDFFVQPMGALNYSDEEFVRLIKMANNTSASAFYIVDSFGVMELKDFRRLLFLSDNNLKKNIMLGYHSHNNLQQAYSNSKYMVEQNPEHDIIIDASIFGMGRGAGNLNIELFAEYLNQNADKNYDIEPFLEVFDECLKPIFINNFWGYSLPFYLSSIHNCHPNYANYFNEKNTLSVKSMHELLSMITEEDKTSFTREKADDYYIRYQRNYIEDADALKLIAQTIENREVLILAPGSSLRTKRKDIEKFIAENNPVIFGINKSAEYYEYDFLFIANEKRIMPSVQKNIRRRILTSNLKSENENDIFVNYTSYLLKNEKIYDDPTFMLINILKSIGCKKVNIAGFDGFSLQSSDNYFDVNMSLGTGIETKKEKNELKKSEISNMKKLMEIVFITRSIYEE